MTHTAVATATTPEAPPQAHQSDRSRAENRLGLRLVAPAVVLMLLVTAYPMIQALYLSLFRYRLTTPVTRSSSDCPTTQWCWATHCSGTTCGTR